MSRRSVGEGESISENTNTYGFLEATLSYGNAWDPENRKPYDRFDAVTQSNFGEKTRVGRLLIRGDLFSKLVGENHSLALQQDFDYLGLNANHNIQQVQLKLEIPISRSFSAGADGSVFFRRSHYDFAGSGVPPPIGEGRRTITQRNPEVRVFLAWTLSN